MKYKYVEPKAYISPEMEKAFKEGKKAGKKTPKKSTKKGKK